MNNDFQGRYKDLIDDDMLLVKLRVEDGEEWCIYYNDEQKNTFKDRLLQYTDNGFDYTYCISKKRTLNKTKKIDKTL